ncbi:MAG: hypothetical protein WCH39_07625 [Schlesneria sp.]
MWVVRLSSILALAVALMLPPGLFRDCCCSSQKTVQRTGQSKLPPCCQAKANAKRKAAQARQSSKVVGNSVRLERPPCRCQHSLTTTAIIVNDQRITKSVELAFSYLPTRTQAECRAPSLALNDGSSLQRWQALDPPLRKTLCRWII